MGFIIRESEADPIVMLDDNGEGGVFVRVGDTFVIDILENGTLELCDHVVAEDVGNLKITEGKDGGWGGFEGRRVRVFFRGEELVLPSELKKAKSKPKTKRAKKADKVIA